MQRRFPQNPPLVPHSGFCKRGMRGGPRPREREAGSGPAS